LVAVRALRCRATEKTAITDLAKHTGRSSYALKAFRSEMSIVSILLDECATIYH